MQANTLGSQWAGLHKVGGRAKYWIANRCIFFLKEANVHSAAYGYRADQMKAYLMPDVVEIHYDITEVCDEQKQHCWNISDLSYPGPTFKAWRRLSNITLLGHMKLVVSSFKS